MRRMKRIVKGWDALRYLVATKSRAMVQRKLRGL
jgi:hypothetical protein